MNHQPRRFRRRPDRRIRRPGLRRRSELENQLNRIAGVTSVLFGLAIVCLAVAVSLLLTMIDWSPG